ncbi:flavin reductase family protein [Streptomyces sp. NEAU-174]|uniref:flavin reductase family protein n=1 Tax=Streptomyces sp. NEAU-174 TaxID=3458254 RepID=UPI0040440C6A
MTSLDVPVPTVERRRAVRHLAAAVAVVTVHHKGAVHGTTVSSLTTVSHEPLLLGVCLRPGSVFADLACAATRFTVNVLGSDQAHLARWFADRLRPKGAEQFDRLGCHEDPYTKAPRLDGALAHFSCRVSGRTPIGDHEVLLAHVLRATARGGAPLLSFAGQICGGPLRVVSGQLNTYHEGEGDVR